MSQRKLPIAHKYISKQLFWEYFSPVNIIIDLQPIPTLIPTPCRQPQISNHIFIRMEHHTLILIAHLQHTDRWMVHDLLN